MKKLIRISLVIGALALLLTNVSMNVEINKENGSVEFVTQSAEACNGEHWEMFVFLTGDGCDFYGFIYGDYDVVLESIFCMSFCDRAQGGECCPITNLTFER